MIKRESKFQTLFRHWLKANPMVSSAFELKQTTTNSIPFSAIEEHQILGLQAATSPSGILFKLPDDSRGIKPFDMFHLSLAYAFIVIKFPSFFVLIQVERFVEEMRISKRRSLTALRALQICYQIVDTSNLKKKRI